MHGQAATLGDFPAPMSLCAITSLIGVMFTIGVQIVEYKTVEIVWPWFVSVKEMAAYCVIVRDIVWFSLILVLNLGLKMK